MVFNYTNKKEALEYYIEEVRQFEIMSNGILDDDYRDFLNKKNEYYLLAIELIRKEISS